MLALMDGRCSGRIRKWCRERHEGACDSGPRVDAAGPRASDEPPRRRSIVDV